MAIVRKQTGHESTVALLSGRSLSKSYADYHASALIRSAVLKATKRPMGDSSKMVPRLTMGRPNLECVVTAVGRTRQQIGYGRRCLWKATMDLRTKMVVAGEKDGTGMSGSGV